MKDWVVYITTSGDFKKGLSLLKEKALPAGATSLRHSSMHAMPQVTLSQLTLREQGIVEWADESVINSRLPQTASTHEANHSNHLTRVHLPTPLLPINRAVTLAQKEVYTANSEV